MSAAVLATSTLEEGGTAGYIALLILVLLFVATYLLIRNMGRRLDRLPERWRAGEQERGGYDDGAGGGPEQR